MVLGASGGSGAAVVEAKRLRKAMKSLEISTEIRHFEAREHCQVALQQGFQVVAFVRCRERLRSALGGLLEHENLQARALNCRKTAAVHGRIDDFQWIFN